MAVTTSDVEARWRALTDTESDVAETLLADAEAIVNTRFPTLAESTDPDTLTVYTATVAWMVIRVLQNPEALSRVQIGDYAETRDPSSIGLSLTGEAEDTLARLLGTSTAFTITPYYSVP